MNARSDRAPAPSAAPCPENPGDARPGPDRERSAQARERPGEDGRKGRSVPRGERLDEATLRPLLSTKTFGRTGWHFAERIDSTNRALQALAARGAPHGSVFIADSQSAGRGRKGRPWRSPPGVGLYVSLLLRPTLPLERTPLLALLGAVAGVEALRETTGAAAKIKWPNDLLLDGQKIAGLLLESASGGKGLEYAIVGLGMNVNTSADELPRRPLFPAGSLRDALGRETSRARLLACWLKHMEAGFRDLESRAPGRLLEKARKASALTGRFVRLRGDRSEVRGWVRGFGDNGALLIEAEDGAVSGFFSGDLFFDPAP